MLTPPNASQHVPEALVPRIAFRYRSKLLAANHCVRLHVKLITMSAPIRRVIRVGVLSEHATLAPLLSSVLGSEFTIVSASEGASPEAMQSLDNIDAVMVDFDRDSDSSREWARYIR